jgi:alkylhydroperoxidase family enzyme
VIVSELTVPEADVPDDIAARLADLGAPGMKSVKSYRVLANHPPVLAGWIELSLRLRTRPAAPGRLRELAIVRVAVLAGSTFERAAHEKMAREHGVSDDDLDAVAGDWQAHPGFSAQDRAVLALADDMAGGNVSDATVAGLRDHFEDGWIIDLVVTSGFYVMLTRVNDALRMY